MTENYIDKPSARKYFFSLRSSLTEAQRKEKSDIICKKILSLPAFLSCRYLLVYYPIKSEADVLPIARKALSLGKSVAFPISVTEETRLDFRTVNSIEELSLGAYGIREPKKDAPLLPQLSSDGQAKCSEPSALCIVPALALDKNGGRLGYGKGYYDRFLKSFNGITVGVAFKELLCERLPTEANDIPLDIIITDAESVTIK